MESNSLIKLTLPFIAFMCVTCVRRDYPDLRKEMLEMEEIQSHWKYKDLDKATELNVLLFEKEGRYCTSYSPPFVIGTTVQHDTIGVILHYLSSTIKKGNTISVVPLTTIAGDWPFPVGFPRYKPWLRVYKDKSINKLHRNVKTVYHAELQPLFR